MRIRIFDGFRGYFLIFMMVMHANQSVNSILGKLNHHYFGWVEDAQGFVFLSGLVVGLVYTGIMLRKGDAALTTAIWLRIRTIYSYQAAMILIMVSAMAILAATGSPLGYLREYQGQPVVFTLASLLLITGSAHMGILPMYIFYMMVTPLVLRCLHAGYFASLAMTSVLLWAAAQTGLVDQLTVWGEATLASAGYGITLGIFFNILGWQVVFFSGLLVGYLMATNRLSLDFLYGRDMKVAFLIGLLGLVGFGLLDRLVFDNWISVEFRKDFLFRTDRGNFSAVYVVAFFLDLFLITWLLGPGRESGIWLISKASNLLRCVMTFGPLVFLGQHSLQVFSMHILCVYALEIVFFHEPPGAVVAALIILASPAPLFLAAWIHQYISSRQPQRTTTQTSEKRTDVGNKQAT